jgi:uncharacterized protein
VVKIRLNEIPQDGRNYTFDRETGELTAALADLLGEQKYSVDFFIQPMGNAYEVRGKLSSSISGECSRCGWEIEIPIDRKINEILIADVEDDHRKTQSVHGNHSLDYNAEGPGMTMVKADIFDVSEFVHEAIALAIPFYPTCKEEKCEHLAEIEAKRSELEAEFASLAHTNDEASKAGTGHPAFSILKSLDTSNSGKGPKRQ